MIKRFKNEHQFCDQNRHDNIIRVTDHGLTENGEPFFVMPMYDGSIRDLIGLLDEDESYLLTKKLLDGIDAAHSFDAIHRDIKPENILFRNRLDKIVIADFGIAQFGEDDLFTAVETKDGTRLANFQYAAPEQRIRGGNITKSTDIYSLGLLIVEIFTGEIPFGKNHRTISSVTEKYAYLDKVVDKMLQQSSVDRYQNIEEIKSDISARGNEYIASLKISELKGIAIPTHEVDDEIFSADAEQFSVCFRGPETPVFSEGIYNMYNETLGYIDLYLQPGDSPAGETKYRAVFSLLNT